MLPWLRAPDPDLLEEREAMQGTVTMYSTEWCGYCRRLKSQLDREGIAYTEINIEQDPASAAFVEKANGGNQTVPTVLVIPSNGGSEVVMTNPSLAQVKEALTA
ncbi:mycoredoxin [Streptomyces thermocoprophilus]